MTRSEQKWTRCLFVSAITGAESINPSHARLIKAHGRASTPDVCLFDLARGLFQISTISALHSGARESV